MYTEFKTYPYIHYMKLTKAANFTTKIIFSRIFKTSSLSLLAIWNYVCWSQGNKKRKIILVRLELWFPIPFFLKQVCQHLLSIGRLVHASFVVFQSALPLKWVSDKDFFNSVLGLQNSTPSLIRSNCLTFQAICERPFQSIICT